MTKLIAALAILAALAWAVTAAAAWITKKKAPLALAAGRKSPHATPAEQDKAMRTAQWRTVSAIAFAALMFAALFRVTVGMSGQEVLPIALTAGLSAAGGLLLYSALPAAKLPDALAARPLLSRRTLALPAAVLTAFMAFVAACFVLPQYLPAKNDAVALLILSLAVLGATAVVLHRLRTTASLPDARMAALDRRWREISAATMVQFGNGALMACFGAAAALPGTAHGGPAEATVPALATALLVGSAASVGAGVVQLALAARGALTIRTKVREGATAPITA